MFALCPFVHLQLDAPDLPRAKGSMPPAAQQAFPGPGGLLLKQQQHLNAARNRQPRGRYTGQLPRAHFECLTDYLISGAIRLYRHNLPQPLLLSPDEQQAVMQPLLLAPAAAAPAAAVAAAAAGDFQVLANGHWGFQQAGLVQVVLGIAAAGDAWRVSVATCWHADQTCKRHAGQSAMLVHPGAGVWVAVCLLLRLRQCQLSNSSILSAAPSDHL